MAVLSLFLSNCINYTPPGLACRGFGFFKFNPIKGDFGRYPIHCLLSQISMGIYLSFTRIFTKLPTFFLVLWGGDPVKNPIIQITASEFKGFRFIFSIKIDGLAPIIQVPNSAASRKGLRKQSFLQPAPKIAYKCDLLHRFVTVPIALRMKYQSVTPVLAKEPYCGSLR